MSIIYTKKCPICQTKFKGVGQKKLCSRKCVHRNFKLKRKSVIMLKCFCGNKFAKDRNKKYCSPICARKIKTLQEKMNRMRNKETYTRKRKISIKPKTIKDYYNDNKIAEENAKRELGEKYFNRV